MCMKLGKMTDPNFQKAIAKLTAAQMPLRTAFKLKGISAKIADQLDYYEDVRQAALQKYGKKNDAGELEIIDGRVIIADPTKFAEEINALLDLDVDVGSLTIEELGDDVSISMRELQALDSLITQ